MTDKIITVTKTEEINLTMLEMDIKDLDKQIEEVTEIEIKDEYPIDVQNAVMRENDERELIKADMKERKRQMKEIIDKHTDIEEIKTK